MELNDKELEEYNRLNKATETRKEKATNTLKDNMNWIMILVLALMMTVLSCLSSVNGQIQFIFPETAWGWILLVAPKVVTAILGYMIWTNFFDWGKKNGMKTDLYKQGENMLTKLQGKTTENIVQVINPKVWEQKQKVKKGIKVTFTTALTTFIIAELIVAFSVASLIGTIVSLLISVVWGLQMMADAEEMYSVGYIRYATLIRVQYENKYGREIDAMGHEKEQDKENALPSPELSITEPKQDENEQTRPDVLPGTNN